MAKIIGNPTVTPMAVPEQLSSIVYTEIDTFYDGVCRVMPTDISKRLHFSQRYGLREFDDNNEGGGTTSNTAYALCIAHRNVVRAGENEQYYQTLILAEGDVYKRSRFFEEVYDENDYANGYADTGWSEWTEVYVTKEEVGELADTYATKDSLDNVKSNLNVIENEGIPSLVYTNIDYFTNGIRRIMPTDIHNRLEFSAQFGFKEFSEAYDDGGTTSNTAYALCIAHEYAIYPGGQTTYYQTLILVDGRIYKRSGSVYSSGFEFIDTGWSEWTEVYVTKDALDDVESNLNATKEEGISSLVYTEIDTFYDGVRRVMPTDISKTLHFSQRYGLREFDNDGDGGGTTSNTAYALCIAHRNVVRVGEEVQYYQTLILAEGDVYKRSRFFKEVYDENDYADGYADTGWSAWTPFKADESIKAQKDSEGNVITDTYATKEEVNELSDTYATKEEVNELSDTYATKDTLDNVESNLNATKEEGVPSLVYTEIDTFYDGVRRVMPTDNDKCLDFTPEYGFSDLHSYNGHTDSKTAYVLCIASSRVVAKEDDETYFQTLIFASGDIYKRIRYISAYNGDTGWSSWEQTYATKRELEDATKWKTLIDTTLTEEQGGVSEVLLAIPNKSALINARQIRIAVSFPVAEEKAVNSFWTSVKISDKNKTAYNLTVLGGYNSKGDANAVYFATAAIDVFDFNYGGTNVRSFHSLAELPTPHYNASANTVKSASENVGGFPVNLIEKNSPYLNISTGTALFEAGTHIFMEVCEY